MNICEIAFSTDWFLTIPGILITCGVILLIIALIMLLISSSKGKKEQSKPNVVETNEASSTVSNPEIATFSSSTTEMPSLDGNMGIPTVSEKVPTLDSMGNNMSSSEPVVLDTPDSKEDTAPVVPTLDALASIPTVADSTVQSTEPTSMDMTAKIDFNAPVEAIMGSLDNQTDANSVVEENQPTLESIANVSSVPTEEVPTPSTSQSENMQAFDNLTVQTNNAYGGVPVVPPVDVIQEESRPIYGGANPLDATPNIPKVEEHHEPYGGVLNTSNSVDTPVLDTTVSEEVASPVIEEEESKETPVVSTEVPTIPTIEPVGVVAIESDPIVLENTPTENVQTDAPVLDTEKQEESKSTFMPPLDDASSDSIVEEL